jgi:hypothetical protein
MAQIAEHETQNSLAIVDFALSVEDMQRQVNIINQVLNVIMRPEVHYGVIPGCGKKPALLKPGAEALARAFQLAGDTLQTWLIWRGL